MSNTKSRLTLAREKAGLSRRKLAKRAGVSSSTVCAIEKGVGHRVQHATAENLANALGVKVTDLFDVETIMNPSGPEDQDRMRSPRDPKFCTRCYLQLSLDGVCHYC